MKRKFLSLILAGAMVTSLAGCKSSDTSADTSTSTPDVGAASVSTPEVEPVPTPAPDVKPEPAPAPDVEAAPTPTPDEEPATETEPAPAPDEGSTPAPVPDLEPAPEPAPDVVENAEPSLDALIQFTESALSQGDFHYTVSAEGSGIIVSVWVDGFGQALSAAVESGFSVDSVVQANDGEVLDLLEREILELVGVTEYGDMPVTLRVLDDRNLEQVLFVISDGEITVFES